MRPQLGFSPAVVFTGRPESQLSSRAADASLTRVRELEVEVAALREELKELRGERDAMKAAEGEGGMPASSLTLMDRPGIQDQLLVREREKGRKRKSRRGDW